MLTPPVDSEESARMEPSSLLVSDGSDGDTGDGGKGGESAGTGTAGDGGGGEAGYTGEDGVGGSTGGGGEGAGISSTVVVGWLGTSATAKPTNSPVVCGCTEEGRHVNYFKAC